MCIGIVGIKPSLSLFVLYVLGSVKAQRHKKEMLLASVGAVWDGVWGVVLFGGGGTGFEYGEASDEPLVY